MSFMLLGILNSQAAGGGGAAFDLLETTTLTSSASSVTFSGLDAYSDYKHLQVRVITRGTRNSETSRLYVTINSTTAGYNTHRLWGDGSSVRSERNPLASKWEFQYTHGSSSNTVAYTPMVFDLLDFSSTSKFKTARALFGTYTSGTKGINLDSCLWQNTAAVTQMSFTGYYDSLAAGTRISIYGIKGA